MRSKISRAILLVLACGLSACASGPGAQRGEPTAHFDPGKDPYWEDPRWDESLLDSVQAAVHDPADPSDTSTPDLHATVKFTYLQGVLEYPAIVTSTGNPDMDKLMLHQLAAVQGPQATGLQSDQPHEFILDLDMPTPFETFQEAVYEAFDAQKVYPKDAIIAGYQGMATLGFDYLDGKLSDIVVTRSSQSKGLDQESLAAMKRAKFPPTPPAYAGKTLHMEASFCYALYQSDNDARRCPTARNVIQVTGTRIRRVDITRN